MASKTIILVGGTGSGKSYLAKRLEKQGYSRIVTYTTRPMRERKIDTIDYHFIPREQFIMFHIEGFFAEVTEYKVASGETWYYGSAKKDYDSTKKQVIVLNPVGVLKLWEDANVVYLDLPESMLYERALKRGDDCQEVYRRIEEDRILFNEMERIIHPMLVIREALDISKLVNLVDYVNSSSYMPEVIAETTSNVEEVAAITKQMIWDFQNLIICKGEK